MVYEIGSVTGGQAVLVRQLIQCLYCTVLSENLVAHFNFLAAISVLLFKEKLGRA